MSELHVYEYAGPVKEWGQYIAMDWHAETTATSENKARSNLMYQFKKNHNRRPTAKIELPGKLKLVE